MRSDKRPASVTMADVAVRAGVSRALVSIVFRGQPGASQANRDRVLRAAEELSYRPDQRARLLGSSRSRTIGVCFGLHHEFHAELVEALYRAAASTAYEVALGAVSASHREEQAVQSLLDFRCEALILIGTRLPLSYLEQLAEHAPVVVVARALRTRSAVDVVRTDDAAGAELAVRYLAQLGHQRIAHVHGGRAPGAAERRAGYRAAMRSAGLGANIVLEAGGLSETDGEAAAGRLLAETSGPARPTAVLAFNDRCATGLIASARQSGTAVPNELSVVGFDNTQVARLSTVALTTIGQDAAALAERALAMAVARAEHVVEAAAEPARVIVAPRLIIRSTSAPPATGGISTGRRRARSGGPGSDDF
jgi:DNA-binding LacI/PurR family transcriptional regulator